MGKRFTYYNAGVLAATTWAGQFGTDYYDHWRAWDAASLTTTGVLIDAALSLTGSGRSIIGTAGSRPTLTNDPIIGKNCFGFDGTSDFMQVLGSTGMYNFLHDGSGGTVIVVFKPITKPSVVGIIVNTGFGYPQIGSRVQYNSTRAIEGVSSNGTSNIYVNTTVPTYPLNQFHSMISTYDVAQPVAANRGSIIVDNGTPSTNNSTSGTPSVLNAVGNFTIGRSTLASFYLNANVAEIIIIKRVLTPTDIIAVNTILTNDYGTFPRI